MKTLKPSSVLSTSCLSFSALINMSITSAPFGGSQSPLPALIATFQAKHLHKPMWHARYHTKLVSLTLAGVLIFRGSLGGNKSIHKPPSFATHYRIVAAF